jgi:hypothetical protein
VINAIDTCEHFREESLDCIDVLTISDDFEKIVISNIVESREVNSLVFKIFVKILLDAVKELHPVFKALCKLIHLENKNNLGVIVDDAHEVLELGIEISEFFKLSLEHLFDIFRAIEYAFEIHVPHLQVLPRIKDDRNGL